MTGTDMLAAEQYYTPAEVAKMLKLSPSMVRDTFTGKPGVIEIKTPKPGRRIYRTIRIPASAIEQLKCS